MSIKQIYQNCVIFFIIGIIEPYLCNGCHDLMRTAMSLNNIAIVYVGGDAYRIHFWYMSEDDAINIMNGSIILDKSVFYKKILL